METLPFLTVFDGQTIAELAETIAEAGFLIKGHDEGSVTRELTVLFGAGIVGDEGREGGVLTLNQASNTLILQTFGAIAAVLKELLNGFGERIGTGLLQKVVKLRQGMPVFHRFQRDLAI